MNDVLVVPEINVHLMSIHTLTKDGHSVLFVGDNCVIKNRTTRVKIGTLENKHKMQTRLTVSRSPVKLSLQVVNKDSGSALVSTRSQSRAGPAPVDGSTDGIRTPPLEDRPFNLTPQSKDCSILPDNVPEMQNESTDNVERDVTGPMVVRKARTGYQGDLPTLLTPEEEAYIDLHHRRLGHIGLPGML